MKFPFLNKFGSSEIGEKERKVPTVVKDLYLLSRNIDDSIIFQTRCDFDSWLDVRLKKKNKYVFSSFCFGNFFYNLY